MVTCRKRPDKPVAFICEHPVHFATAKARHTAATEGHFRGPEEPGGAPKTPVFRGLTPAEAAAHRAP